MPKFTLKNWLIARYADDLVCHCKTMREAIDLKSNLQGCLAEVGLELSLEKSRVVYVDMALTHEQIIY